MSVSFVKDAQIWSSLRCGRDIYVVPGSSHRCRSATRGDCLYWTMDQIQLLRSEMLAKEHERWAVAVKRLRMSRSKRCSPAACKAAAAVVVPVAPAALRSGPAVHLPHHVILDVISYLESREIVRTRNVARAFMSDAPALVDSIRCLGRQKFPTATSMNLFPRMAEVHLDGDTSLVEQAAPALVRCSALRRLTIARVLPQLNPLTSETTALLCGLQLSELDIRRVRIEVPPGLTVSAWCTLDTLVLREAGISDVSLSNLFSSSVGKVLPLRHLDLSRNLFGEFQGMGALADALKSFPNLESLELTADRITDIGAKLLLATLLEGSCLCLNMLELSLNFLGDDAIDFLAEGLGREGHGLRSLQRLGFGGRFVPSQGLSNFNSLGRSLANGTLPQLEFLHLQGDVSPADVGPLFRELRLGACPKLSTIKVERSTRYHPEDDPVAVEDTIESMLELVTSSGAPMLKEVHVLGMNLGKGLETGWAPEENTAFYRATNMSSFHRLAAAGSRRGVMIFV